MAGLREQEEPVVDEIGRQKAGMTDGKERERWERRENKSRGRQMRRR